MPNFYKNSTPFFYNNFYRKRFQPQNCPPFSTNCSLSQNINSFSSNCSTTYNNVFQKDICNDSEKSHKNKPQNLPPNVDFVLDLFGLKLYFDDVLILSLLFFLYKEDVKDEWLFLALVLLLIS